MHRATATARAAAATAPTRTGRSIIHPGSLRPLRLSMPRTHACPHRTSCVPPPFRCTLQPRPKVASHINGSAYLAQNTEAVLYASQPFSSRTQWRGPCLSATHPPTTSPYLSALRGGLPRTRTQCIDRATATARVATATAPTRTGCSEIALFQLSNPFRNRILKQFAKTIPRRVLFQKSTSTGKILKLISPSDKYLQTVTWFSKNNILGALRAPIVTWQNCLHFRIVFAIIPC